ncbi:hypothetical protein [Archangium sp. Cb G35]|uniref:hypothetical protein n=1 Tax=Archangium sp. Cb G35 TaxID=1920190 RepID=UPI000AA846C0|nr:hypothetical protein [Archangium sp. Cb G35]
MSRRAALAVVCLTCLPGTSLAGPKPKRPPAPPPPPAASTYKHASALTARGVETVLTDPSTGLRAIAGKGLYEYAPGDGLIIDRVPADDKLPASDDDAIELRLHGLQGFEGQIRTPLARLLKPYRLQLVSFANGAAELAVEYEGRAYRCTVTLAPAEIALLKAAAVDATCSAR